MERFEELPDFDGNIDLSTLDTSAATLRGTIGLGHFGLGRHLLFIGIGLANFQFLFLFQFGFGLGFECPPQLRSIWDEEED